MINVKTRPVADLDWLVSHDKCFCKASFGALPRYVERHIPLHIRSADGFVIHKKNSLHREWAGYL
jgi:hypothetical protein